MASFERCAIDEHGNLVKITIGGETELVLTGSCVLATSSTAPPGTLIADGSEVSRQAYAKLFEKIGTQYGEGDGETTFALPDWRDEFPRFSGAEREVGSKQGDAIRNFSGTVPFRGGYGNNVTIPTDGVDGIFSVQQISANGDGWVAQVGPYLSSHLQLDVSSSVPTADENRPRNVAFLPCIVYI